MGFLRRMNMGFGGFGHGKRMFAARLSASKGGLALGAGWISGSRAKAEGKTKAWLYVRTNRMSKNDGSSSNGGCTLNNRNYLGRDVLCGMRNRRRFAQ